MNILKILLFLAVVVWVGLFAKNNLIESSSPKFKVGDCVLDSHENEFQVKNYKLKIIKVGKEDYWVQLAKYLNDDPNDGFTQRIKSLDKSSSIDCSADFAAVINK